MFTTSSIRRTSEPEAFSTFTVRDTSSATGPAITTATPGDFCVYGSDTAAPLPPPPPPMPMPMSMSMPSARANPYTYRGPNGGDRDRNRRLHQDFKALSKEERQRLVEQEAADSDLLARTVHLRFLPTSMRQCELAALCAECGEYLRVRICGNSTNNQNWIYGFVEFATKEGAARLMARSGMELANGPNRPPLRLKCNSAKQPIVDRVFHDADQATHTPCIFGLGNFANRSLKDALDSYFNLKAKEAQQQQMQQVDGHARAGAQGVPPPPVPVPPYRGYTSPPPPPPLPGARVDPLAAASVVSATLSPSAKAFHPSGGSSVSSGAAILFLPGVHNAGGISEASSDDCGDSGTTLPPYTTGATPGGAGGAYTSSVPSFWGIDGGSSGHADPFSETTSPQITFQKPGAETMGAYTPLPRSAALRATSADALTPEALSLPPVLPAAAAAAADAAGAPLSALSHALQTMLSLAPAGATDGGSGGSILRTSGAEVIARAQALLRTGLAQSQHFYHTQRDFYDAVGSLRSLLELLDRHAALTGTAAHTGAGGGSSAALPQRATQLRLLAHLVMALLYMSKREMNEALPSIQAVVSCVHEIPTTAISGLRAAATTTTTAAEEEATAPVEMMSPVGGGAAAETKPRGTFDFLGDHASLLLAAMEPLLEEDDDGDDVASAEASNLGAAPWTFGLSGADGAAEVRQREARRDAAFHRFVLHLLVAVGLALQDVHPSVSQCVYALAARRAKEVLDVQCAALDEVLAAKGAVRLSALLYSEEVGGDRDITAFPRIFFTTPMVGIDAEDEDVFWACLPPLHCVSCFHE